MMITQPIRGLLKGLVTQSELKMCVPTPNYPEYHRTIIFRYTMRIKLKYSLPTPLIHTKTPIRFQ